MRIAVTGANGLLGSRLCALLAAGGDEVVALGRGPRRAAGSFGYRSVDLTVEAQAREALEAARPEAVVHAAAMTEVDACEGRPDEAFAGNTLASAYVAKACKAMGAHLIAVSTDYLFDGESGPYAETDLPNPRGRYALTKHMAEQAVQTLAGSHAIARTAVVYGWPQAARPNFASWLYTALKKGEPVRLFADQFVSPTLADNLAEMLAEVTRRKLQGLWHLAGDGVIDRVSFGKLFCEELGLDASLIQPGLTTDGRVAAPRPRRCGLKVNKAKAELQVQPLNLPEALRRFRRAVEAAP